MRRLDPRELYELDADRPPLTGAVLLHALDGFVDAGRAVEVARDHLLASGETRVIARFDVDQLHDYRARRPPMLFDRDRWASVAAPELVVHLLHDVAGAPFLLFSGPEPDVQWERFAEAVRLLVTELGVRLTVGLSAFPMPLPHTRPTPIVAHASRPELLAGFEPWLGEVLVPGSVGNWLELRLGQAGLDTLGLAAPIPPYLAQTSYPAASAALLREVASRTGLLLPLAALDEAAAESRRSIDAQVEQSEEVQALVRALEEQYAASLTGAQRPLLAPEAALPSADELGAELERFLAEQAGGSGTAAS